MSRCYRCRKTGNELTVNLSGGQYLDKITVGLFKNIGCYPRTPEDCKLVVHVFKNYVHYAKMPLWEGVVEMFHIELLPEDQIDWLEEEIIPFFENATEGLCYPATENCYMKYQCQKCGWITQMDLESRKNLICLNCGNKDEWEVFKDERDK